MTFFQKHNFNTSGILNGLHIKQSSSIPIHACYQYRHTFFQSHTSGLTQAFKCEKHWEESILKPFGYLRPKAVLVLCNSKHTSFCLGVNDMLQQDVFFSFGNFTLNSYAWSYLSPSVIKHVKQFTNQVSYSELPVKMLNHDNRVRIRRSKRYTRLVKRNSWPEEHYTLFGNVVCKFR